MDLSNNSMLTLVKKASQNRRREFLITIKEYEDLINELWQSDEYLQKKYSNFSLIPTIYSLYGVKLLIKQE
jgi:hypothetical protein